MVDEKKNLFQKYGFNHHVFNPHGVTEDLSLPLPLPVREVKTVVTRIFPEIEKTLHYSSNMIIPIIGDYGSGKTEIMNFIFRLLLDKKKKGEKIQTIKFYRYQPSRDFSLLSFLNEALSEEDLNTKYHHYIFIDEIDDIPRDITRGLLKKELAKGRQSYAYLSEQNPDLARSRFALSSIKLEEAEPWVGAGKLARHLYFYSSEEYKQKILEKNPYYPFSEGVALAITRLSAFTNPNRTPNMRLITLLYDRLLYWSLKNGSFDNNKKIWVPKEVNANIVLDLLRNPLEFANFDEEMITSLKKLYSSFEKNVNELMKTTGLDKEEASTALAEIIFSHLPISEDEFAKKTGLQKNIAEQIIDILLNSRYIECVYTIDMNRDEVIDTKIEISKNKGEDFLKAYYNEIYFCRYRYSIDKKLGDFSSNIELSKLKLVEDEFFETIMIKKEIFGDIESISPTIKKEKYKFVKKYIIHKDFWEEIIREGTLTVIGKSKFLEIEEKFNRLNLPAFQTRLKKFLEKESQFNYLEEKKLDKGIIIKKPRVYVVGIKQTKNIGYKQAMLDTINGCWKLKEITPIEGIIFVLEKSPLVNKEKLQESLKENIDTELIKWISDRVRILQIKREILISGCFYDEILQDERLAKQYGNAINEIQNEISNIFTELVNYWLNKEMIPVYEKVSRSEAKLLLPYIIRLFELITNTQIKELGDLDRKQKTTLKKLAKETNTDNLLFKIKEIDKNFLFGKKKIVSNYELKALKMIFKHSNEVFYDYAKSILESNFIFSKSKITSDEFFNIMQIKGIIKIDKNKKANRKIEFISKNTLNKELKETNNTYERMKNRLKTLTPIKINFDEREFTINIDIIKEFENNESISDILSDCHNIIKQFYDININLGIIHDDLSENIKLFYNFEQNIEKIHNATSKLENIIKDLANLLDDIQNDIKEISQYLSQLEARHKGEFIKELNEKLNKISNKPNIKISELHDIRQTILNITSRANQIKQGYKKLDEIKKNFENLIARYNAKIQKFYGLSNNTALILKFGESMKINDSDLDILLSCTKEKYNAIDINAIELEIALFKELKIATDYFTWSDKILTQKENKIGIFDRILNKYVLEAFKRLNNKIEWLLSKEHILNEKEKEIKELKVLSERLKNLVKRDYLDFSTTGFSSYTEAISKYLDIYAKINKIIKDFFREYFDIINYISDLGANQVISIEDLKNKVQNANKKLEELAELHLIEKRWVT